MDKGPILIALPDVRDSKALAIQATQQHWHDVRATNPALTYLQHEELDGWDVQSPVGYLMGARIGLHKYPSLLVLSDKATFPSDVMESCVSEGKPYGMDRKETITWHTADEARQTAARSVTSSDQAAFIACAFKDEKMSVFLLTDHPDKYQPLPDGILAVFSDDETGRQRLLKAIQNHISPETTHEQKHHL